MKSDANGAVGESGTGGDFVAGHAFDEAEDEGFAVGVGERADRFENGVGFGAGVRGVIRGRSESVGLRGVRFFVEFFGGFCAAMKICGAVAGDGGEPSGEVGNFAESGEARQGLEEDVLQEIVYVGEGNSGEEYTVDHAGVTGIEKAEGRAITTLSRKDQGIVWAAGFADSVHGRGTGPGSAEF